MVRIYVFDAGGEKKAAERRRYKPSAPLAYFEKKAAAEPPGRAALTRLEGELLARAMELGHTTVLPDDILQKSEFGKLEFTNKDKNRPKTEISFSHSKELLVLCISLSGAVGIDVEPSDRPLSSGVRERFLSGFYPEYSDIECEIYEALPQGAALSISPLRAVAPPEDSSDDMRRWTAMEALVKMQGGGISSYGDADGIMKSADLFGFVYKSRSGKSYTVTVAKEKEKQE